MTHTNPEVSVVPTQADELRALIEKATQSDLADDGRYFRDSCNDLTSCRHGETGEYNDSDDGKLVEFLWNNRHDYLARLAHQTPPATIPVDVARLVVAAREAGFEDPSPERTAELIAASEAFADRVPWDDEPEDAAELRAVAPPATQPIATVGEVERALFDMIDGFSEFMDIVPAERAKMRERARALATLHTPPPVATATVVDARLLAAIKAARGWYGPADDEGMKEALTELDAAVAAWSATPTPPAGGQ